MGKVISFRFSDELHARLDRYAAMLSERAGVEVPLSRVVVKLLEASLDEEERRERRGAKKK
jgi:hypothetical protein